MPTEIQSLIDRLDDLLEMERRALLAGDLEEIGALLERKEQLIDSINALEIESDPDFAELRNKLVRNHELLDGALAGIRAVAARMVTIRRARQSLETYDEYGERQTITGVVLRNIEKRA